MSEHDQQCCYVEEFDLVYPKYSMCLIASLNGAFLAGDRYQRARQIANHKKAGMKPGVSDLFLAVPRGGYHGLFIEMKDVGKTACSVSDDQAAHLNLMNQMGYYAVWCAGAAAAMSVTKNYMSVR